MHILLLLFNLVLIFGGIDRDRPREASRVDRVAVIVHKDVPVETIDRDALVRIYLMEYGRWTDGARVKLFDLKGSNDAKTVFFAGLDRKPRDIKRTWMRLILSGEAASPTTVTDHTAMLDGVASTPGAIGYLPLHLVDDRVKVVARFP